MLSPLRPLTTLHICAILFILFSMTGCVGMQMGSGAAKTTATGSTAGSSSQNVNPALQRCDTSLGSLAVVEETSSTWYRYLTTDWKLGSTTPVLKMLAQQSNCFVIVERGRAMDNLMQERALMDSGELRKGSTFQKGQMVAADYSMSPSITFNNNNAGKIGGALGGVFGSVGSIIGSSLNFKQASTILTLIDNRTGVQLAASEGSAKNIDLGFLGSFLADGIGLGAGGYANTAEGKVLVAAFTDSFNNMITALQSYKAQEVKGGLGTGGTLKVQAGN